MGKLVLKSRERNGSCKMCSTLHDAVSVKCPTRQKGVVKKKGTVGRERCTYSMDVVTCRKQTAWLNAWFCVLIREWDLSGHQTWFALSCFRKFTLHSHRWLEWLFDQIKIRLRNCMLTNSVSYTKRVLLRSAHCDMSRTLLLAQATLSKWYNLTARW